MSGVRVSFITSLYSTLETLTVQDLRCDGSLDTFVEFDLWNQSVQFEEEVGKIHGSTTTSFRLQ